MKKVEDHERLFELLLVNEETNEVLEVEIAAVNFASAASKAYMVRSKRGFEWKIRSIVQL